MTKRTQPSGSILPKRGRGRCSAADQAQYDEDLRVFLDLMVQIQSGLDLDNKKYSSRGWCYLLEPKGLLKGDFDKAEDVINDARKHGLLPVGFMKEEAGRSFSCIEEEISENTNPVDEATSILEWIPTIYRTWKPISFHDDQDYYIQMLVEKIDLVTLFEPVCKRYFVPIASTAGWSSIGQREKLIGRFQEHEAAGRASVLLYCGDFDPAGLHISEQLRKLLNALGPSTGWCADDLIIDRFGLNKDFIEANGFTWIDNLATGSKAKDAVPLDDPTHRDHKQPYVQTYLAENGARKCEANVLVLPEYKTLAEKLCEDAINQYVPAEAVKSYADLISKRQERLKDEIKNLVVDGYLETLFEDES